MKTEHIVHPLPKGRAADIVKAFAIDTKYASLCFFLLKDGKVYLDRRWGVSARQMTDRERRAYCALSGVKYAILKAEFAKQDARELAKARKRNIASLRYQAEQLGYRIVRVKPAP